MVVTTKRAISGFYSCCLSLYFLPLPRYSLLCRSSLRSPRPSLPERASLCSPSRASLFMCGPTAASLMKRLQLPRLQSSAQPSRVPTFPITGATSSPPPTTHLSTSTSGTTRFGLQPRRRGTKLQILTEVVTISRQFSDHQKEN